MKASSAQSPLSFRARIKILGINPYVLVSKTRATMIKPNWRKPLPVLVRINSEPTQQPWRLNMMPVGDGSFYLYLHGEMRRASHSEVGDTVSVEIVFDPAYQNGPMHPMPEWFSAALRKNKTAHQAWNALIPSRQKEIVRYFSGLKSAEAQQRNLIKIMDALSGKRIRFMARTWNEMQK